MREAKCACGQTEVYNEINDADEMNGGHNKENTRNIGGYKTQIESKARREMRKGAQTKAVGRNKGHRRNTWGHGKENARN